MHGVNVTELYAEPKKDLDVNPFVYVMLPSDDVCAQIMKRAILIKEIIDVFSVYKQPAPAFFTQNGKETPNTSVSFEDRWQGLIDGVKSEKLLPILSLRKKFKFSLEGVGRHISMDEMLTMIEMFKKFPFYDEDVSLDKPEIIFKVVENCKDQMVYCGVQIAAQRVNEKSGKGTNDDTYFSKYTLKKRPYLGPTSTDHELALLMANQAQIRAGDMVYDPFVGTGSIALACQHFGSYVIGSDLDMRVLKGYAVGGKTKNKIEGLDKIDKFDIYTNFKHYGLPRPDILAMDISALMFSTAISTNGLAIRPIFDAIVCDPPYGVRARSQKIGIRDSRKDKPQLAPEDRK